MKCIYLTEEGKQEIEAKIAELEKIITLHPAVHVIGTIHRSELYKEILASAIILPVEESWEDSLDRTEVTDCIYANKLYYPQGVIIQTKQ
jgi:hypothetical protein